MKESFRLDDCGEVDPDHWRWVREADAVSAASANPPDYKFYHISRAASHIPLSGKKVLVVGCNRGWDCKPFVELGASEVTGLDVMDEIGVDYTHERVSYVKASAESIPLRSGSFNLVFSYATLEHVHDIQSAFAEMTRVMALHGFVYTAAAPLWCTRQGPHWASAYDHDPWPHLRCSTEEVVELGRSLKLSRKINQYYEEEQIRYCLNARFFNQRRSAEYLNACAVIEGIKIIRNDIELERQEGFDPTIVRSLIAKGYSVFDLFGLTHIFIAQRNAPFPKDA